MAQAVSYGIQGRNGPEVYPWVINRSMGTLDFDEIYNVTNTGFTIRKKIFNGTTITTSNYGVYWMAVGESA